MNAAKRMGLAGVAALAVGLSTLAAERRPKALLIMLDGVRADAIANAHTPNLDRLMAGRWQPGYTCAWSLSGQIVLDAAPDSAPNHSTIATCACAAKHGVQATADMKNGRFAEWPIWLKRVTDVDPSRRALYIFSWWPDKFCSSDPRVRQIHGTDEDNARALPKILAGEDAPDATLYYVDLPDHGGHATSFCPSSLTYLNAVNTSDRYIGDVLDAIASRKTFDEEDWLIMVTADHGGYQFYHGNSAWVQARTIPVILAGRNVPSGELKGRPFHHDLTATALKHFGLDAQALNLDGHALDKGETKACAKRALTDGLQVYLPFDGKVPVNLIAGGPVPELFGTNVVSGVRPGLATESGIMGGGLNFGLNFSGEKCGLRLKGSENLEFENGSDFTVAVWVRNLDHRVCAPIFANKNLRDGTNPGIALRTNGVIGRTGPGVWFSVAAADRPRKRVEPGAFGNASEEWMFYAATYGADGVVTLYQGAPDGHFYWVCEETHDPKVKALPFHLGQDGTGLCPNAFRGGIDEFALWTRTLGRDELRAVFEAARTGREVIREALRENKEK